MSLGGKTKVKQKTNLFNYIAWFYRAFYRFGQAVLGSSQFSIMPSCLKIDPKLIVSLRKSKSVTHTVVQIRSGNAK